MNSVELVGWYGSDITHSQSAWTSTKRELSEEKINRIPQLLRMLATEGHHTPFEKSSIHFLVTTDIATHIQILKSRIACSVNAESARYKELKEDKYYLPEDWINIKVSKDVGYEATEYSPDGYDNSSIYAYKGSKWVDVLEFYAEQTNMLYHQCLEDLTPVLGRKRAKESARFFKMYNSQITADVMFNFRSFNHFLGLRMKENAQKEIMHLSKEMLTLVQNIEGNPFKYTLEAFGYSSNN